MTRATAAATAWLALIRKGFGGRRDLADAMIEAFDAPMDYGLPFEDRRKAWQELVTMHARTAGWEAFCASARARFDLT